MSFSNKELSCSYILIFTYIVTHKEKTDICRSCMHELTHLKQHQLSTQIF